MVKSMAKCHGGRKNEGLVVMCGRNTVRWVVRWENPYRKS